MTRDEAKKLLPVIQAFADGKDVEWLCKFEDGKPAKWRTCIEPTFFGGSEYRIKPEPLECWVAVSKYDGHIYPFRSKALAEEFASLSDLLVFTIHHMREVLP